MASTISAGTTSGTAIAIAGDTSGQLELKTNNGTTAVTIDTSQNATVVGNVTGSALVPSGSTVPANGMYLPTTNSIAFATSSTKIMSILSNGSFIIGTATTENGQNSISFGNSSDTASYGKAMLFNTQYNSTRNAVVFQYNSGTVGTIVTGTSNTSYNTSSDYRLKEDIAPMANALATVSALKPVTYKWKIDGSDGQGFIANELQAVVPEAVTGVKDAVETYTDEDGNEQTRIKPQGIDTSFLVATLTAAIQEQQAMITALQADVQALKGVA